METVLIPFARIALLLLILLPVQESGALARKHSRKREAATALLLRGEDANDSTRIEDSSGKPGNLSRFGSVRVSTSVKKYGTGSLFFDNSTGGSYLHENNSKWNLGSSDLTVEFWIYLVSSGNHFAVADFRDTSYQPPVVGVNDTEHAFLEFDFSPAIEDPTPLSLNTWYHIAVVRQGDTWTLYKNGVSVGSVVHTGTFNESALTVGTFYDSMDTSPDWKLNGYLDNLRITIGKALYTSGFTPRDY